MKELRAVPESTSTHEKKMRSKYYVLALLQSETEGRQAVWIDETNFNIFCARTMGCSSRATSAQCTVPNILCQKLHLIGALTSDGLIDYNIMRGNFKKERCAAWLRRMLDARGPSFIENCLLICDNAPCHTKLERVFQEESYSSGSLLRLVP
ncbi:unnamed protein product [Dicrocoelium dendriticum]|nr:unnamed protein product [Dicrocoelium dendriticum]